MAKFEFTPTGQSTVVLGNDDDRSMPFVWTHFPEAVAAIDKMTYPGAATTDTVPRGNLDASFGIRVSRVFATSGAAILFMATETFGRAGQAGTVTITAAGGSQSILETTCQRAAIVDHIGMHVKIEYSFTGGHL